MSEHYNTRSENNLYWLHISHNVPSKSKRQTLRNGFALIEKWYHTKFLDMIRLFYSSNMQSRLVTGSLEIVQELKQVRFVWFPLLICNLFLLQISSYKAEYLNGTDPVIDGSYRRNLCFGIAFGYVRKSGAWYLFVSRVDRRNLTSSPPQNRTWTSRFIRLLPAILLKPLGVKPTQKVIQLLPVSWLAVT